MAYLHGLDILHGDLSGNNILLACNSDDERGFTAKVADFGLARMVGEGEVVQTRAIGTITHMPPELMLEGVVFAFAFCILEFGHALHAVVFYVDMLRLLHSHVSLVPDFCVAL